MRCRPAPSCCTAMPRSVPCTCRRRIFVCSTNFLSRRKTMLDPHILLLIKANLKQLRLPAMHAEFEKLARQAAASNESFEQFLLRLTELEVTARSANVLKARIKQAAFPIDKDFDTYDFSAMPSLSKPKILELARGDWLEQRANTIFVGQPGTGKTHLAT